MKKKNVVNIGLIGLGTIGAGVAEVLRSHANDIEKKTGIRLVLKKACDNRPAMARKLGLSKAQFTTDAGRVLGDKNIDIVVELIGGIHPAKEFILRAFKAGKHVVTANKALLAEEGKAVFGAAARHKKELGIEASVCGGIPIIKSIREGLASNNVTGILGIVNGTCNYILTEMSRSSKEFSVALSEAQAKGYAEKNPALDIDGIDSKHKLVVLARVAFQSEVPFKVVSAEGIRKLALCDIEYARQLGYVIKLLAIGKKSPRGLELRVHPTLLPADHPVAHVNGVYNAALVHGDQVGDILFYGKGAGRYPTTSAVMSDILDIAKKIVSQAEVHPPRSLSARVLPADDIVSKYYLRFQVKDRPGVLGTIAKTLGSNGISILSVHQKEMPAMVSLSNPSVPVVILTYAAREKALRRALKVIDRGSYVREKTTVIRVED